MANTVYRANVSDSAGGTIASLEHALESFEDRLREREIDHSQSRRQSADLTKQLDQRFEHDEKLAAVIDRQQEIIAALDVTKNQASATVDQGIRSEDGFGALADKPAQTCARRQGTRIGTLSA